MSLNRCGIFLPEFYALWGGFVFICLLSNVCCIFMIFSWTFPVVVACLLGGQGTYLNKQTNVVVWHSLAAEISTCGTL